MPPNERWGNWKRQDDSTQSKFDQYSELLIEWNLLCVAKMKGALNNDDKAEVRFWRAMII